MFHSTMSGVRSHKAGSTAKDSSASAGAVCGGRGMGIPRECGMVTFSPKAVSTHDAEVKVDFLDSQEVKVVKSGDGLNLLTFFVRGIEIESVYILKSNPE